jgi:hypothetical protein
MHFESVLIITYGRSGSTLLQGLLNSIEGCVVRGENYNMCYGLFLAWQSLHNTKHQLPKGDDSKEATSPWFGAALLDEERFFEDARSLIRHQLIPDSQNGRTQCIGFKEIRYLPADFTRLNLADYLSFLAKLFPKPAFIVLTRDHGQVVNSAWWTNKNPDQVKLKLKAFEKDAANYAKGKNSVFFIDYQDMTSKTRRLKQMFEFLGAPYMEKKIDGVLSIKHSYSPEKEKTLSKLPKLNKDEHYYKIEKMICSELAHFSLDKLAEPLKRTFILKGIAVLKPGTRVDYRLIVRNSAREYPVLWGLPSPVFAQKHPEIPTAGFSRFKVEGVNLDTGDVAEMHLVDTQGDSKCLARITLMTSAKG